MRTLVHRTQVPTTAPGTLGPGSTVGPIVSRLAAPLTWVGKLSIAGAAFSLIVWAWPWAMGGVPLESGDLTALVLLREIASIATILLPAALEFGYPRVARRNPWLLRGTLLLALALLARPLAGVVQGWAMNALLQAGDRAQLFESEIAFALVQVLAISCVLLEALGWLAFLRGLFLAHARPRGAVMVAFALAGIAVWVAALVPSFGQLWASDQALLSTTNAIWILVGLCRAAATAGVAAALLAGAVWRLQPHLGWALGAATAVAMAAAAIADPVQVLLGPWARPDGSQDDWLLAAVAALDIATSLLLLGACLAGIGRGTNERRGEWPRRRAYVVTGDRRLRPAGRSSPIR